MAGEFRQGFERRSGGFAGPPLLFGLDSQGLYDCLFKGNGSWDQLFVKNYNFLSILLYSMCQRFLKNFLMACLCNRRNTYRDF